MAADEEDIGQLLLEELKAIRTELSGVKMDLKENAAHIAWVEISLAGMRRDLARANEGMAD